MKYTIILSVAISIIACNTYEERDKKIDELHAKMDYENTQIKRFSDSARRYTNMAAELTANGDYKASSKRLEVSNAFLDSSSRHNKIFWEHYAQAIDLIASK